MARGVLVEHPVPLLLAHQPRVAGAPAVADLLRDLERAVFPAQRLARGLDLVLAQRGAVRGFLAGLVRRAEADRGAAAEQHRLVVGRSEEPTSELQSLMPISYAVFGLK